MKRVFKTVLWFLLVTFAAGLSSYGISGSMADQDWDSAFDVNKMSDMSDFDPNTWVSPKGDTIKIAVVASHSGPSALNGQFYWTTCSYVAHDINKRGGILVDGKKKLVEIIKADTMGKVDQTKKICEKMVLKEKVDVLWGCDGSHIMKVINAVANKYKVIALNASNTSDDIQNAENFGRYSFHGGFSCNQTARGLAYYYGQIRKKEKKFYILCQDYGFGHIFADSFKQGLKEYFPEAEIVGEDYHKLFLTDFAPYISKIKSSGAEVIFSGDWDPDAGNLAKQAQHMGVNLPFANIWMISTTLQEELGPTGGNQWVHVGTYFAPTPFDSVPGFKKYFKTYVDQHKKFTGSYNGRSFETLIAGITGSWFQQTYWLLDLMERLGTTDPEKIIPVWEGDRYRMVNGKVITMRPCDHKAIQDLSAEVYLPVEEQKNTYSIPPYRWVKTGCYVGKVHTIPADKVLPWMDPKLDRCKGKDGWGK